MRQSILRRAALTVGTLIIAAAAPAHEPLHYRVTAANPANHFFQVELNVPPADGCPDFAYAVWTPGGYTLHPHAEDVLDVTCTAPDGGPLKVAKTDLNTWHVTCSPGGGYTARIRIHALADRTPYSAHLGAGLLFANGVSILPYLPADQDLPAELTIDPPPGWPLVCSLPATAPHTFHAGSWDELADAIFAAAPELTVRKVRAGAAELTLAFTARPAPGMDMDTIAEAHKNLVLAAGKTFGGIPFDRYLFLYKVGPKGSHGGLEHSFGTAMGIPASALKSTDAMLGEMGLPAHELVHAWNVKRARPAQLRPYDYAHVRQTDLLWVAEGWTSYYGPLLLTRSGVRTPEQLYATLTRRLRWHRRNPANRFLSLRQISLGSWLDWSVPFFSFRSYYVKGSLAGLQLDLLLRRASAGRHSLDDIMRALLADPQLRRNGYTEADLRFLAGKLAGRSMDGWFAAAVDRPGYIDLAPSLASVGLRLVPDEDHPLAGFTGIRLAPAGEGKRGAKIRWVEPSSPAEEAGLGEGDTLLAVKGRTGAADRLAGLLDRLETGKKAVLTVLRADRVLEVTVVPTAVEPLRMPVRIEEDPDATAEQVAARRAWLWSKGR